MLVQIQRHDNDKRRVGFEVEREGVMDRHTDSLKCRRKGGRQRQAERQTERQTENEMREIDEK